MSPGWWSADPWGFFTSHRGRKMRKGDLASLVYTPGGFRSSCQHYLMLRPRRIPPLHPQGAVTRWLVAVAAGSLQLSLQFVWACWQCLESPVRVEMDKDMHRSGNYENVSDMQTDRYAEVWMTKNFILFSLIQSVLSKHVQKPLLWLKSTSSPCAVYWLVVLVSLFSYWLQEASFWLVGSPDRRFLL